MEWGCGTDDQLLGDANQEMPKEVALLDLMKKTGYSMMQENGQRKYGPPPGKHVFMSCCISHMFTV